MSKIDISVPKHVHVAEDTGSSAYFKVSGEVSKQKFGGSLKFQLTMELVLFVAATVFMQLSLGGFGGLAFVGGMWLSEDRAQIHAIALPKFKNGFYFVSAAVICVVAVHILPVSVASLTVSTIGGYAFHQAVTQLKLHF